MKSLPASERKHIDVNNYEILRTLGMSKCSLYLIGSYGRVRLVKDKKTGDYYAFKILKKIEIMRAKETDHIISEMNILSQIEHPFIVNTSLIID